MPGIFGVIDAGRQIGERASRERLSVVERMSAAMTCEADSVRRILDCGGIAATIGIVRRHGAAPITWSATRGPLLLASSGDAIDRPTDAGGAGLDEASQSILDSYERCGSLNRLDLQFRSGVLVDESARRLLLFNDTFGHERIFVHAAGSRTYFASEAKAILAVAPRTREFDMVGLAQLFGCGCTLGARSLFRDIEVLAPASVLSFEAEDRVSRGTYFSPQELEASPRVAENEYAEGFAAAFARAASGAHLGGSVGVSVTGGLDSRMVMAALDVPPRSIRCYTFGSMYRTSGDVRVGREVARMCDQPHTTIELGTGFLARAPEEFMKAVYVSDGYMGWSGAAELYLNRQARSLAPVRLTGNWGGELMRGVRAFKYAVPGGGVLAGDLVRAIRTAEDAFRVTLSPVSAALFQQLPDQGYGRYAIERSQVAPVSPFLAPDVIRWIYRAPNHESAQRRAVHRTLEFRPPLLALTTDAGQLRGNGFRRVIRRASIKAEYLTSHGAPAWVARTAALLPQDLLETRFLGIDKFQHFRHWLRRDLAPFARDVLATPSVLPFLSRSDGAVRLVDAHVSGRANHTDVIDKLMMVAAIQNVLFNSGRYASALQVPCAV
jgi:asparagine synthase (glutamine-hydrolysing)